MTLVPSLTRNQWLWLGGAAVLGVTEVLSAPLAVAIAVLPVLDNIAKEDRSGSSRTSASATGAPERRSGTRRRSPAKRATSPRRTSTRTAARRGRAGSAS